MKIKKLLKLLLKVIKKIDSKLFKSAIQKKWSNYKLTHGEQIYNFRSKFHRRFSNGKKLRVLKQGEMAVNDLFLAQYYKGDYSDYKHMDAAVRLLAIEEHYGQNHCGFELYRRMQMASGFDWTERFQKLIKSYEETGYSRDSSIEVGKDFAIMDGSHRLTLALHSGQEFINTTIYDKDCKRTFDYDWFWKNGFADQDCRLIKEKKQNILEKVNYEFVGVVWPPAMGFADELMADINSYDPENVRVMKYQDLELETGEFDHLFRALYHTDILDQNGMDIKIAQIKGCMEDNENRFRIRVFYLKIQNPQIGMNPKNLTPQSQVIKQIKEVFRKRYEPGIVNYKYDVIMHISDNYLQSKFCSLLFEINRDLTDFYSLIKENKYTVIRAKESRQSPDFPHKFYYRSDTDILVADSEDMKKMAALAEDYARKHFNHVWIKIEKNIWAEHANVMIKLRDFMLYQFDFITKIYGLSMEFSAQCLEHTLEGEYKYLPAEDEIMIRILEYMRKPHKAWYAEYIHNHKSEYKPEKMHTYIDRQEINIRKLEKHLAACGLK